MMRILLPIIVAAICSCSKKQKVFEVDDGLMDQHLISGMGDVYKYGFPEDFQGADAELRGLVVVEYNYRNIPLTVIKRKWPTSYGSICDMWVYYKYDALSNPSSTEWRQCSRFSARSYSDLQIEFDEKADTMKIFGIVPKDNLKKLLMIRESFHDSFTGYIPDHG